jgi:hypothetical protein
MAYEKRITITKDGEEATIMEPSWPVYERNGWTRADDGSSTPDAPVAPAQPAAKPAQTKEG